MFGAQRKNLETKNTYIKLKNKETQRKNPHTMGFFHLDLHEFEKRNLHQNPPDTIKIDRSFFGLFLCLWPSNLTSENKPEWNVYGFSNFPGNYFLLVFFFLELFGVVKKPRNHLFEEKYQENQLGKNNASRSTVDAEKTYWQATGERLVVFLPRCFKNIFYEIFRCEKQIKSF